MTRRMMENLRGREYGYILLDIIFGLFIFSFGFIILLDLFTVSETESIEAENYICAVNIARSTMDEIIQNIKNDNGKVAEYLEQSGSESSEERYKKICTFEWGEVSGVLDILVEIHWKEKKEIRVYCLESCCYVET